VLRHDALPLVQQREDAVSASTPLAFREGDRCRTCGYWYWERNGEGWHSLVPITYADHPEEAHGVLCPVCKAAEA
jgi:rubredoxin